MPTLESVVRSALAAVDTDANVDLAGQWANFRIQEATAYGKFRFLRLVRNVTWPATVQVGTITVAQGDTKVFGDGTAAPAWNTTLVGRMFQSANVWYDVAAAESGVLILGSPYTEASVTGVSYKVTQHVMALPDYRRVDQITLPRLRRLPMEIVTRDRMDTLAPSRLYLASGMRYVCAAGEDVEGNLQIEVYPWSSQAETLRVLGYRKPPELTLDEYIPGAFDVGILKEGLLVDIYKYEHARAVRAGNQQQAMLWQQQLSAQERRWTDSRMLLALQDREVDDAAIQPEASGQAMPYDTDIVTAWDQIYSLGRRP